MNATGNRPLAALAIGDVRSQGLSARVAKPSDSSNGIGVLVLPGVSGVDGTIDRALGSLVQAGFIALAWDPFYAYDAGMDVKEKARIAYTIQQDAEVLKEHRHWVGYMQHELGCARVAALGFCMGGRMSLLLAAQDGRIATVVAFYPTLRHPKPAVVVDPVPLMAQVRCAVQVHYPGKDTTTSHASFNSLRTALEARTSGLTSVYFYPEAHHAFLSRAGDKEHPDAAASALAWPATLSFLSTA
jgi:carboxymethylenebutenolidase